MKICTRAIVTHYMEDRVCNFLLGLVWEEWVPIKKDSITLLAFLQNGVTFDQGGWYMISVRGCVGINIIPNIFSMNKKNNNLAVLWDFSIGLIS